MHVTAKADYAIRAAVELADSSQQSPFKMDAVAEAQGIPPSFLENIFMQLRSAGVVCSHAVPTEATGWLVHPMSSTLRTSSGRSKDRWWACAGTSGGDRVRRCG